LTSFVKAKNGNGALIQPDLRRRMEKSKVTISLYKSKN
jgi:hypothetical protein